MSAKAFAHRSGAGMPRLTNRPGPSASSDSCRRTCSSKPVRFGKKGTKLFFAGAQEVDHLGEITSYNSAQIADLLTQVNNPFYGHVPSFATLGGPQIQKYRLLVPFPQIIERARRRAPRRELNLPLAATPARKALLPRCAIIDQLHLEQVDRRRLDDA